MPAMYLATGRTAGTEISSTYEGRHITIEESLLAHPTHTDGFVDKGDPVLLGEDIIGVALLSAAAATDFISIDTEGIWFLSALAENDWGDSAIAPGDALYVNKTTLILSKMMNKNTHQHFGYALGDVAAGDTDVVAVKVHWDPDDAEEKVGTGAVPFVSALADHIFREYRYQASGTGTIRGAYHNLELTGVSEGEAVRGRTVINHLTAGAGSVHGGHFGIEFGDDGEVAGQAAGLRGTFLASNKAQAGTIYGGITELFAAGAATDYGTSQHAIHCFANLGEATGRDTADNVFAFNTLSAVQNQAHNAWVAGLTRSLQCTIDGAVYYLGMSNAP